MNGISGVSMRGEADVFRRMNNLSLGRSKRNRSIRIRGIHLVIILLAVSLVGYVTFRVGHFLLTWERLEVKTFKLVNPPKIEAQKLQNILAGFKGNILTVQVDDLNKVLLAMPQVQDVAVYRRLPDTVEIRFTLKKPVLQWQSGARIWYYDASGNALYEAQGLRNDLMTCQNVAERDLINIGRLMSELSPLQDKIEFVSYCKPFGLVIKLKKYDEIFYPGESEFIRKISRFLQIRAMDVMAPYRIKVVDLRFSDRIYIEQMPEEVALL